MAEAFVESSLTPTDVLSRLKKARNVSLLTGTEDDSWGKIIAWNPVDTLCIESDESANDKLKKFIEINNSKNRISVGYVSYDYGYKLQEIVKTKPSTLVLPTIFFCSYEEYVEQKVDGYRIVYKNPGFLENFLAVLENKSEKALRRKISFATTTDERSYEELFNRTKEYIKKGHVYQLNLTHNLEAYSDQNPRLIFADLANKNMAKMMSYFEGSDFEILSISPERFIRTNKQHIETFPIKGTRPRQNNNNDKVALAGLVTNQKELSELSMITDLLRNDLGKVCEAGSVRVEKERDIQVLSNVFHTYSKIAGRLKDGLTPIGALLSMFPGGSITGCPKKRAMEIIDEIEPSSRGIYCGCMVVIDSQGNLDSSILIRTIIKKNDRMVLPVGGGIVFDSKLSEEYQETIDKAASLRNALS